LTAPGGWNPEGHGWPGGVFLHWADSPDPLPEAVRACGNCFQVGIGNP
jgi:hypothetical protein